MADKPVARPGTLANRRRIAPTANLKVDTRTLTRAQVDQLLNDFSPPNWPWPKDPVVYKALIVHGSPFVSLSISPTRASQD